jgi:hypothetical protein
VSTGIALDGRKDELATDGALEEGFRSWDLVDKPVFGYETLVRGEEGGLFVVGVGIFY